MYTGSPVVMEYVSTIQLISLSPVDMSGAGMSTPGPMNPFLASSTVKRRVIFSNSFTYQRTRKGWVVCTVYVLYVCSIGPVDSHMLYVIRIHMRLHHSNSIITYIHSTNPDDSTHLYVYKTLWKPCNTYVCTHIRACSNWIEKTRHCFSQLTQDLKLHKK